MSRRVIVEGAGIAGINTALSLAQKGYRVLIVEKEPYVGGKLSQLDYQFPNDACGMCQIYPFVDADVSQFCLRKGLSHPYIDIITNAIVDNIEEKDGYVKVTIFKKARGVNNSCINCEKCTEVCPVIVNENFNYSTRKAIYHRYERNFPDIYTIDFESCTRCGACVSACPVNAINLEDKDEYETIEAEHVFVATGIKERDISYLGEFGYGKYKNVIMSTHFERMFSGTGVTEGIVKRPSDGKVVRKIAFIQCMGSRDKEKVECSSICCMFTLKEIRLLKKHAPLAEATVFYMDMRTFGKDEYQYALDTEFRGIRTRPGRIVEDEKGNPIVGYIDENGNKVNEKFDLVVLAVGTDVVLPEHAKSRGVTVLYESPVEISDALINAEAAISHLDVKTEKEKTTQYEDGEDRNIVIVNVGENTMEDFGDTKVLTVPRLQTNSDVEKLKASLSEYGNYFVVIDDSIYMTTPLLKKYFDPLKFYVIDKNYSSNLNFLVNSAVARLKYIKRSYGVSVEVEKNVLVVGAGIAGMTAASLLASKGVIVHIVEKSTGPGGNALAFSETIDGRKTYSIVNGLVKELTGKRNVHLWYGYKITDVKGFPGNYMIEIRNEEETQHLEVSAVVIASGAEAYKPTEYLYEESENIITQMELEKKIADGLNAKTIVMIQCVGSRNTEHPWCSRVCCSDAVKNALRIKNTSPEIEVFILYRDMMTYGKLERKYREAREKGVIFIRFNEENPPSVSLDNGIINVQIKDDVVQKQISVNPNLLILSTGIVPNASNEKLARLFSIPLDKNGFFKPSNIKFNPIETPHPGVYLAGLAHSPRSIEESEKMARAAASKVLSFLRNRKLPEKGWSSYVKERKCTGCGICVSVCPYNARFVEEDDKVAKVITSLCQGCGVCVSACPSNATELTGFESRAIMESLSKI